MAGTDEREGGDQEGRRGRWRLRGREGGKMPPDLKMWSELHNSDLPRVLIFPLLGVKSKTGRECDWGLFNKVFNGTSVRKLEHFSLTGKSCICRRLYLLQSAVQSPQCYF
jgi:hypothetical protein